MAGILRLYRVTGGILISRAVFSSTFPVLYKPLCPDCARIVHDYRQEGFVRTIFQIDIDTIRGGATGHIYKSNINSSFEGRASIFRNESVRGPVRSVTVVIYSMIREILTTYIALQPGN